MVQLPRAAWDNMVLDKPTHSTDGRGFVNAVYKEGPRGLELVSGEWKDNVFPKTDTLMRSLAARFPVWLDLEQIQRRSGLCDQYDNGDSRDSERAKAADMEPVAQWNVPAYKFHKHCRVFENAEGTAVMVCGYVVRGKTKEDVLAVLDKMHANLPEQINNVRRKRKPLIWNKEMN